MDLFKEKVLEHCKDTVRRKIELIAFSMDEISGSMENETKSSAGDKHETARAKMQSEHEKLSWQLDELKNQYEQLTKIDKERSIQSVSSQNLVYTDKGIFFIIIPLGKVELDGKTIYVISPGSPLGKSLIGLKLDEKVKVNEFEYRILSIL
ncbi:3-oxoacyl-ACP synthase [Sphingobacteriaceae bacterium]|nr:3-oxoacyl-ACP synthase [Sphingobacteriaceae bacterium]